MDFGTLAGLLALLVAIGALAGVLAGLLGVGGGIVLVPAFFYTFQGLGYGGPEMMQVCLGTSLATIIVTSMRSIASHNKKGAVDWTILKTWAPGIAIGALIGVFVASGLKTKELQVLFGCLGILIGLYMAFGKQGWQIRDDMPTGWRRAVLSPVVGFLSVLMGIGGGSFGVPIMTLCGRPIHRAVATAAGFGLLIALPSSLAFLLVHIADGSRPPYTVGAVNIPAFLVVICMTTLTAPLGAKLAHATDPKKLKKIFAFFLMLVALNMLRKALLG
ncbi:sulfite exporter TauE/SafE family protein [Pseudooceanicola sp. CBS1P-1]|uniref:Probable membrane transporter protein n=1 Tax=Pseudooceanicola albus TaxID=2692189 RepID=A0A6L7FYG8_9RHOB|nr:MULTISPECIES: sulfite exporter TauE/SafE family protein [Pseudooceanicola]MBT9382299.1 sulfite exporter TauE/SafE family protein [Pseudooceanicola endophyticus]MXN16841.1 TSUP family transporter [Pseudooceanicola albus]